MARFERKENPPRFSDYRKYVPFLRKDFLLQCAYCERTEEYLGGEDAFEVEHFRPRSKFPNLISAYTNLYYVCRKCNAHKSETWPTDDQALRGIRFADPCAEDFYTMHVLELEGGTLQTLTLCGEYSSKHIRLDRSDLREWRRRRAEARADLPYLTRLGEDLEDLLSAGRTPEERKEIANQLAAVRRRIVDSKRRFFLN